jgi:hypothetical protein
MAFAPASPPSASDPRASPGRTAEADMDVQRQVQRLQALLYAEREALLAVLPSDPHNTPLLPKAAARAAVPAFARLAVLDAQLAFAEGFTPALLALQRRCRQTRFEIDNGSWLVARRELYALDHDAEALAAETQRVAAGSAELEAFLLAQVRAGRGLSGTYEGAIRRLGDFQRTRIPRPWSRRCIRSFE